MTTWDFDRSAVPSPRIFYEHEGLKLSRPSRGWARSRCPLHGGDNPTSFAVNLDTGGFFCHSCGAKGGDVLEFVRLRYQLSFPDALNHFHIECSYQPRPKKKEPRMSLEQRLARKLAMAVEYGKDSPNVR